MLAAHRCRLTGYQEFGIGDRLDIDGGHISSREMTAECGHRRPTPLLKEPLVNSLQELVVVGHPGDVRGAPLQDRIADVHGASVTSVGGATTSELPNRLPEGDQHPPV
jgi:hypothetical protein